MLLGDRDNGDVASRARYPALHLGLGHAQHRVVCRPNDPLTLAQNRTAMTDFDLVSIGGGAGGLAAARAAAVAGKRAALVTDSPIGGDCTWTGCVPSKTLISAAAQGLDFTAAMRRVRETIRSVAATEGADVLEAEGVTVIAGRSRLLGGGGMDIDGRTVSADNIVLATGARPGIPLIPGLQDVSYLTNENVWGLEDAPARLGVVGGGAIGCELTQAMARLGVEVTQFEVMDRLMSGEEPEASDVVRRVFEAEGISVRLGRSVASARSIGADGRAVLDAGGDDVEVDKVLVAAGRVPRTQDMGLETAGVELTERGYIKVNDRFATTAKGVWAVGDVTGVLAFTHAANEQGMLVGRRASGVRMTWKFDPSRVPWATFTSPEVARVGVLEADAPRGSMVAYLPMTEHDRAIAEDRTDGFIKLIAAPRRVLRNVAGGRIVGATIVGERAGEMIHGPALAMLINSFTGRLAQLTHAYPTWSFGIQKCAGQFFQGIEGRKARPAQRG
jgi:pyruvate/2-oxoglutarate dehydrogenase complex dihydrolipoamide dehydrogenase (E3) component